MIGFRVGMQAFLVDAEHLNPPFLFINRTPHQFDKMSRLVGKSVQIWDGTMVLRHSDSPTINKIWWTGLEHH